MRTSRWYWVVAVALVLVGTVSIFSIGALLLLLGVGLLAVGPWRDRPGVVRAVVAGVVGLAVGYVLLAPLTCTSGASASISPMTTDGGSPPGGTRCTNVLGIPYGGGPAYDPPLGPAFAGGLVVGAVSAALAFRSGRRERRAGDRVVPGRTSSS